MFWSSMRWRVITETDCGISRSDSGSLPPTPTLGAVYEPLPSVTPTPSPCTVTGASVAAAPVSPARFPAPRGARRHAQGHGQASPSRSLSLVRAIAAAARHASLDARHSLCFPVVEIRLIIIFNAAYSGNRKGFRIPDGGFRF